jgi:hypothetical protein
MALGGPKPDGSSNYFLDLARPVPYDLLAGLAVITFKEVFGVAHPGELEYNAFSTDRMSVRFPHLGLKRRAK